MNSTSEYSLTIVVPVFNEEDNIRNLEKPWQSLFRSARSRPASSSWTTVPPTGASG